MGELVNTQSHLVIRFISNMFLVIYYYAYFMFYYMQYIMYSWMVRDLNMPFGGMKASGTGRESAQVSRGGGWGGGGVGGWGGGGGAGGGRVGGWGGGGGGSSRGVRGFPEDIHQG